MITLKHNAEDFKNVGVTEGNFNKTRHKNNQ